MDREATDGDVVRIFDQEIITLAAFDFFDGIFEWVGVMEEVEGFVHLFFGTVGFFDFEGVQGFGVNDADDLVVVVDYGKISKTGFVEFVKR